MEEISRNKIEQDTIEWAKTNISSKFEFREYQLEQIVNIVYNIINNKNHTHIIEAPTGSGKSLLNIISAGLLADYWGKTSYILVSDLFLWKQYEDFVNKHPIIKRKYGILKGQTGNYTCLKNNQDMRNAECQMAGMTWGSLFDFETANGKGYSCVMQCEYVRARKKASRSKVCIMTYQLYHFLINVVAKMNENNPDNHPVFVPRDIIFCDECHNIPSIIKNNFAPEIKHTDYQQLKVIYEWAVKHPGDLFEEDVELISKKHSESELYNKFCELFDSLVDPNNGTVKDDIMVNEYIEFLVQYGETVNLIESHLRQKKTVLKQKFNSEDIKNYKACSFYRNCMCFWNDYMVCVSHTGKEYVVKTVEESRTLKENVIQFNIAKEDFISWYFLLNTADNRVMMSATLGGYDAFYENTGIKWLEEKMEEDEEVDFTIIPSTFNFEKSPIHFLNRYKMSYREKSINFPKLKNIIYSMCEKQFNGLKGMIQTGSYINAKELYDDAPDNIKRRMLLYNNSKEKTSQITMHQMSQDTILVGPTLVEGVDLPGDDCRFIVILKVPYPVITDVYVKKKIELFPKWYNSSTSNTIIQGVGRGNRFKDDWCVTYILDACFLSLYNLTKDQYPKEFQQRIKIYN